ncbi:HTH_38 domain-containing protein [Trichonephila clavipes]|nr:HTH_38 domain-containing protein [Trichonephila clavipes]
MPHFVDASRSYVVTLDVEELLFGHALCLELSHIPKILTEFDRGGIVAYRERDCVLSFREIGSRVGRNQTTVMRICDRWMQEDKTDRRGRLHPPQCTTSPEWSVRKTSIAWSTLDAETQTSPPPMSDSSLETPWREDAEHLRYAPPRWSCIGYYGMGRYWISLSHSSSTHCWYFKQPAIDLRGVGASCPSLPSGLGHSHISTG